MPPLRAESATSAAAPAAVQLKPVVAREKAAAVRPERSVRGSRAIELLVTAVILVETTGKKRDRSFVYRAYLDRLRVGTELARSAVHR